QCCSATRRSRISRLRTRRKSRPRQRSISIQHLPRPPSDWCAMSRAQAFVVALLLCWALPAAAEVAVPPLTGRVVDLTGTLSADQIATLSQRLKDLQTRKGSQVAVLIVPTTQPETIEQYSLRVAEAWKIGRRKIDDGALLVVAKNDHRLRIEVG